MLRFSRFAPVDQLKRVGKQKETRSVSEGLFDFSDQPLTRSAIRSSALPHPWKRHIQERQRLLIESDAPHRAAVRRPSRSSHGLVLGWELVT
ncbi:MAG: hypothetical protein KDA83_14495 [Planctomycetales bacterium]|nr:hypothetical protein [Planctomycetales bacterium]